MQVTCKAYCTGMALSAQTSVKKCVLFQKFQSYSRLFVFFLRFLLSHVKEVVKNSLSCCDFNFVSVCTIFVHIVNHLWQQPSMPQTATTAAVYLQLNRLKRAIV